VRVNVVKDCVPHELPTDFTV
jgi:hypothetical protein